MRIWIAGSRPAMTKRAYEHACKKPAGQQWTKHDHDGGAYEFNAVRS